MVQGQVEFQTLTIGRHRDSDIRLKESTVSRRHAEVTVTGEGRYYLIDCGSLHGTQVNGGDGAWVNHRQGFVEASATVRFGAFEACLGDLVSRGRRPDRRDERPGEPARKSIPVTPQRNLGTAEVEA